MQNPKTGETNISVDLTEDEAKLFLQFRKFQDVFNNMTISGVFDLKGSSATLHFDENGELRKVEVYKGFKF